MARAFICGVSGLVLTDEERHFLSGALPWGLIIFKRNVRDQAQLSALTSEFRALVGRSDAPVLVDQEGGRVQRLGPPVWPAAGVDMALHCNGDLDEARQVAAASPVLDGRAASRAAAALKLVSCAPEAFDPVDARARLDSALAMAG